MRNVDAQSLGILSGPKAAVYVPTVLTSPFNPPQNLPEPGLVWAGVARDGVQSP
jgi:hypothetical protein